MPNELPVSAYQVPNPDEMVTAKEAAAFGRLLGSLGFATRIVVSCAPNVRSQAYEVPLTEVPSFDEPVNCLVYIAGQAEQAAHNIARLRALYTGPNLNGPSIASFAALWGVLNPGKPISEAYAALLGSPAIAPLVKNALVLLG